MKKFIDFMEIYKNEIEIKLNYFKKTVSYTVIKNKYLN